MNSMEVAGEIKLDERLIEFGMIFAYSREPDLLDSEHDDGVLVVVLRIEGGFQQADEHHGEDISPETKDLIYF